MVNDSLQTPGVRSSITVLDWIAGVLLVIGGLNWGMVGLFSIDVVAMLFGIMSGFSRLIYILVGISAVYAIVRGFMRRGGRSMVSHVG